MVIYGHLAATLSKLMNAGCGTSYYDETVDCYEKVIEYREKHLGLHHVELQVAQDDFSNAIEDVEYNVDMTQVIPENFITLSVRIKSL